MLVRAMLNLQMYLQITKKKKITPATSNELLRANCKRKNNKIQNKGLAAT